MRHTKERVTVVLLVLKLYLFQPRPQRATAAVTRFSFDPVTPPPQRPSPLPRILPNNYRPKTRSYIDY